MQPMQSRETSRPVRPNFTYSMASSPIDQRGERRMRSPLLGEGGQHLPWSRGALYANSANDIRKREIISKLLPLSPLPPLSERYEGQNSGQITGRRGTGVG